MSDLQAYGYIEHQPCECLDCGREIQAGWRCFRCAVCGLHVAWNLQILTAAENLAKGNR